MTKLSVVVGLSTYFALSGFQAVAQDSKPHSMHQHSASATQAQVAEVITSGVVKGILPSTNQLKIRHQPIPEWSMGAMQMKFFLAPYLEITDFQEGQEIKFRLHQKNMMKYTILEILDK
ncbi:MAG: copper-binding protein [Oceanospirillaceae bacterium]|nr:copper-binding protein [Oceanospirillaceae bacterium]